ncbi:hypothetical protein [Streptomyces sp. NPDC008137]|uniref:hypothetical protein n=1 Tax=Streptomyces sp. NPDC008137 TaxID=3364813 RepID=UPI0036E2F216
MAETIFLRGEGGAVIAMDLPLPEGIAERFERGQLTRVHSDGSPYYGAHAPAPAPSKGSALTEGRAPRPSARASKEEWVTWALAVHGQDSDSAAAIEEMTKAQLVELPDEPVPGGDSGNGGSDLTTGKPGRPSEGAPKSEWIAHVVSLGLLSAEDAANYTKDDLIELAT